MCGRFVGFKNIEQLKQHFPIDEAKCDAAANYNVAPTQTVLAIARLDDINVLDKYHWGLVPFWAKDASIGYKMINARAESVSSKPSFREPFKKRRCLILADGFFEWTGPKGDKQPVFITLPDASPFAFAGLWEIWRDKTNPDTPYRSCTIITRPAAGAISTIHHRMPVILDPEAHGAWLDPANRDPEPLINILETQALTDLALRPVSKQVNAVRNNDPSNIKPVQLELDFN